jgi:hypothetical protein
MPLSASAGSFWGRWLPYLVNTDEKQEISQFAVLLTSTEPHFRGLFRRARLSELISRAHLAELIDPNSSDKDILNSSS